MSALLEVEDLTVVYGKGAGALTALDRVSLSLDAGSAVGVVGESGSGKSTFARALVQIIAPESGRIRLAGEDVTRARGRKLAWVHENAQMVFQDPYSALNPRQTIGDTLREAVWLHERRNRDLERPADITRLLDLVTLDASMVHRYPHELSGGQLQRVGIARALAARPRLLILDEVTSALDVSVQAAILNLLRDLRGQLGLTYVCISHDLSVVGYLCESAMVLHLGRVAEVAPCVRLFSAPAHPYTRSLLQSVPLPHGEIVRGTLTGEVPDPRRPPSGCRFHPRCPVGPRANPDRDVCFRQVPQLEGTADSTVACHFPLVGVS